MKKIKLMKILLGCCLMLNVLPLFAQNVRFTEQGVIEFEKRVNTHAVMKRMMGGEAQGGFMEEAMDGMKNRTPQFNVFKSSLSFRDQKTLFVPQVKKEDPSDMFGMGVMGKQNNIIYSDFSSALSISQRNVLDEVFLVKDSLRRMVWKITEETREIAGYSCRRANGLMLDSIYVVAFYTDKIPVSGGPESFSGLPGMILGVALPHENITWFATKVTDTPVNPQVVVPPVKGKAMDGPAFKAYLSSAFKQWGGSASAFLKSLIL
jgi:GLPGLI family protein